MATTTSTTATPAAGPAPVHPFDPAYPSDTTHPFDVVLPSPLKSDRSRQYMLPHGVRRVEGGKLLIHPAPADWATYRPLLAALGYDGAGMAEAHCFFDSHAELRDGLIAGARRELAKERSA